MNIGEVVLELEDFTVRGPMPLTLENIQKFWEQARKYRVVFGEEVVQDSKKFMNVFLQFDGGVPTVNGLFFIVNDFLGAFYLTEIVPGEDALAHYVFFDRKLRGRKDLVQKMMEYVFKKYQFHRLSAEIPNYASAGARHFIQDCGFAYEGKKRKAAEYKGDRFDVNLYGILRNEVLKDGQTIR